MGIQCGIVGLPNVGKSTLFNALTESYVEASNYPFCTIDPNVGIVNVPDPRLEQISSLSKSQKTIPTTIEFVDIAGLVKGASKGEGLGNQFLSNIRQVDAIAHVVRCFDNDKVVHVHGQVDPAADIEVIETELILKDMETVQKRMEACQRKAKSGGDKEAKFEYDTLEKLSTHLDSGRLARYFERDDKEAVLLKTYHLLTDKPVMYVANTNEEGINKGNAYIDAVKAIAAKEGAQVVTVCADIEMEIGQLEEEEKEMFLESMGMEQPGLHRVINAGYELLGLCTYFTSGEKETRAWTVKQKSSAPQAAGVIHTDFEKGFIRAEVMHCEHLFEHGSESAVKEKGLYRVEGKEYVVKDGDIMFFRFNV